MIAVIALAFTLMVADGFAIAVVATGRRAGDPLTGVVCTVTDLIVSAIAIQIALHWKKRGFYWIAVGGSIATILHPRFYST